MRDSQRDLYPRADIPTIREDLCLRISFELLFDLVLRGAAQYFCFSSLIGSLMTLWAAELGFL